MIIPWPSPVLITLSKAVASHMPKTPRVDYTAPSHLVTLLANRHKAFRIKHGLELTGFFVPCITAIQHEHLDPKTSILIYKVCTLAYKKCSGICDGIMNPYQQHIA